MAGSEQTLSVWLGRTEMGTLSLTPDANLTFLYHEPWQSNGFALSPFIPLDNTQSDNHTVLNHFFRNCLPEGLNLDVILQTAHLSRYNTFGLLHLLKADLPGALHLQSADAQAPTQPIFIPLSHEEIVQHLASHSPVDLIFWGNKPRLSLAGVHQKINVMEKEDELGFAEGSWCSTHILKFETDPKQMLVLNEAFMMQLAQACGLNVAQTHLRYYDDHRTLLVKRFDRELVNHHVNRRHVIDGCQLLNLPPEYKYERTLGNQRDVKHVRDGANLSQLFHSTESFKFPARAKQTLLDWVLFNLLIGNWDSHGKNISFIVTQTGIEMAPFYDLVNVRVYPDYAQELAMALGDEFDASSIHAYELAAFCEDVGLNRVQVRQRLLKLCEQIEQALESIQLPIQRAEEQAFIHILKTDILTSLAHFKKQAQLMSTFEI